VAIHYRLQSNADLWGLVGDDGAHLTDCEIAGPAEHAKDYANAERLLK